MNRFRTSSSGLPTRKSVLNWITSPCPALTYLLSLWYLVNDERRFASDLLHDLGEAKTCTRKRAAITEEEGSGQVTAEARSEEIEERDSSVERRRAERGEALRKEKNMEGSTTLAAAQLTVNGVHLLGPSSKQ